MRPVTLPEAARFTCRSCGHCCQGWAVPVDQATVTSLRSRDWGGDPFEAIPTAGRPFRIKLVEGRCFFLDGENRCRIHTEVSYEAKPEACRAFPLSVLDVGGQSYARLSHWCPTVTENVGKPLEQQLRWVRETSRHAESRTTPIVIQNRTLAGRELDSLHRAIRQVMSEPGVALPVRLAAVCALALRADSAAQGPGAFEKGLQHARESGTQALADEIQRKGAAGGGRRVLALYLLNDVRGGRLARVLRFGAVFLFNAGVTRLRSTAAGASASWRQLRRVRFEMSSASKDLLTRYFVSKIDSRRYLAADATIVEGLNLLVAAYGIVSVLARTRAAAAGRSATDEEDIREGVRAADLLVVEHQVHGAGLLHQRVMRAALAGPTLGGDVLACLDEVEAPAQTG